MTSSFGDSDSDFGDFEGVPSLETPTTLKIEDHLNVILGSSQAIPYMNEEHTLKELLEDERPKVVYEQLVILEPHLQPFQWRHSKLRSELLHTLQIEDIIETPKVVKILDRSLYESLSVHLETPEGQNNEHLIAQLLGSKLQPPQETHQQTPIAVSDLRSKELDSLNDSDLSVVHDQLIDAILTTCRNLREKDALRAQLIADKNTFEDLVTNLIGHTQRLRRDEIAQFNKKNRKSSKYSRKFKWVR
ncbi:LAME_0F01266g1_1 [Lachancea meyersii CBS 8951]|uniref:LAME_0F01266g1_1 n=1 Tax=Lachancea meyersii CBS 8951 TaxID=1266667 RepID=A0A1G4JPP4_9SACH|nr:LAME_0F01266g1_1 [Lachancea meyersii CBS 8951]